MTEEEKKQADRDLDRRRGSDRRQTQIDPADLPFPDRRKGDRRQMDRRVMSEEEREALKKIIVPDESNPEKTTED
jgi:hypothetical protein